VGDAATQARICEQAAAEIPVLIAQGQTEKWRAWISYHNYYKAPDLLGPAVAGALGIPYLQIESTRARKRLQGPWQRFAKAAEDAADAASVIFHVTERDGVALHRDAPPGQQLLPLAPFLSRHELPATGTRQGPMLAVGMMRTGDKLASYRIIAETLALLPSGAWSLVIAGDGSERRTVETMMAPFGDAVRLLGALTPPQMDDAYRRASLLFWPGVNEAFGLAYLEAQAHGLPVVAQDRPGVRDVLAPDAYPPPDRGAHSLAGMLRTLLADDALRRQKGDAARAHVAAKHLLPSAAAQLRAGLQAAGVAL
jgi:hypothetical protein